jgi:hypothetical protein
MYNLDNYRGITLTSNVYKVYAKIIEQSVMSYMEDNGILSEVQGVFRRDRRTEDNIFTLQDLMFSRWILSDMGISEVIRFWSIFETKSSISH